MLTNYQLNWVKDKIEFLVCPEHENTAKLSIMDNNEFILITCCPKFQKISENYLKMLLIEEMISNF